MLILGLTGSIAMGKSRCARMFAAAGAPVLDSDAVVHALYAPGGAAVAAVEAAFPGSLDGRGGINRGRLGAHVLGRPDLLRRLEGIVHGLVRATQLAFLRDQARQGRPLAVLDIPLLLEGAAERRVDRVAVVSASPMLQRQRALQRPRMSEERLRTILEYQMPDAVKRRRADFVIPTGFDRGGLADSVRSITLAMRDISPTAWPARWLSDAQVATGRANRGGWRR